MSNSLELGLVLDTTQYMYNAIKDLKDNIKDILRIIPTTTKPVTIFVVTYNKFNTSPTEKLERLDAHQINKCIKAPYKQSILPPLQPIPVFTALNRALSYNWKASKRILLLVGSNPPHGIQYHKLGKTFDSYPEGNPVYDLEGTVRRIQQNKVDFCIINIGESSSGCGLEILANKFSKKIPNMILKTIPAQMLTAQTMTEILKQARLLNQYDDDEKNTQQFGWYTDQTGNKIPVLIIEQRCKKERTKSVVWDGEKVKKCYYFELDAITYKQDRNVERLLMLSYHHLVESTKDIESLSNELINVSEQHQKAQSKLSEYHRIMVETLTMNQKTYRQIKWMRDKHSRNKMGEYVPVLVVQQGKPIVVIDAYGTYHEIQSHALLLESPPFQKKAEIVSRFNALKTLCGNTEWKSNICGAEIILGQTTCKWKDTSGWTSSIKEGIIQQFTKVHSNQFTVVVCNLQNVKKPFYLKSDEIQIVTETSKDRDNKQILELKRQLAENNRKTKQAKSAREYYKSEAKRYNSHNQNLENERKNLENARNNLENERKNLLEQITLLQKQCSAAEVRSNTLTKLNEKLSQQVISLKEIIFEKVQDSDQKQTELKMLREQTNTLQDRFNKLEQKNTKLNKKITDKISENEENDKLVSKLRERLLDTSSTLDFADGFPAVQDIIVHYDTTKTQFHFNASKLIKNSLKKNNKNLSKSEQLKNASKLLFDILIKSYKAMQLLEKEQKIKTADAMGISSDNKGGQKVVEKNMRKNHKKLFKFNKIETEKAQTICNECIEEHKVDQILQNDAKDSILLYCGQCLQICWEIVLSRDPQLTLDPLTFESEEKIEFDDELYEAVGKSNIEERLNFVIWPSMVRTDRNYRLSKIIAVFLNKIPSGKGKKKKINKKPSELEAKNDIDEESGSPLDLVVVDIKKD